MAAGFGVQAVAPSLGWTALGVVLTGLGGGGQATLPAACWAELYGTRHLGSIKAVVASILVAGSAWGPGVAGLLIDRGIGLDRQLAGWSLLLLAAVAGMAVQVRAARRRMGNPARAPG